MVISEQQRQKARRTAVRIAERSNKVKAMRRAGTGEASIQAEINKQADFLERRFLEKLREGKSRPFAKTRPSKPTVKARVSGKFVPTQKQQVFDTIADKRAEAIRGKLARSGGRPVLINGRRVTLKDLEAGRIKTVAERKAIAKAKKDPLKEKARKQIQRSLTIRQRDAKKTAIQQSLLRKQQKAKKKVKKEIEKGTVIKRKKFSLKSAIATFDKTLEKRRREANSVSRELTRKQQEGKTLTKNEKRALVAAGLQNVGIEALDSFTWFRNPKRAIVGALTGIGLLLTQPEQTLKAVGKEIKRNPAGFTASIIGAGGSLNVGTRVLGTVGKVGATTVKTVGTGSKTALKVVSKAGANKITIVAKATGNKIKAGVKVVDKAGKTIANKTTVGRAIKSIGKKTTRQKSPAKLQDLAKRKQGIINNIENLNKVLKTAGKQKGTTGLVKQIQGLKKDLLKVQKQIGKQPKATIRQGITKAELQARALERFLKSKGRKPRSEFLKQFEKNLKDPFGKKAKALKEAKKLRRAKRKAERNAQRTRAKEIRKPFQKRNRLKKTRELLKDFERLRIKKVLDPVEQRQLATIFRRIRAIKEQAIKSSTQEAKKITQAIKLLENKPPTRGGLGKSGKLTLSKGLGASRRQELVAVTKQTQQKAIQQAQQLKQAIVKTIKGKGNKLTAREGAKLKSNLDKAGRTVRNQYPDLRITKGGKIKNIGGKKFPTKLGTTLKGLFIAGVMIDKAVKAGRKQGQRSGIAVIGDTRDKAKQDQKVQPQQKQPVQEQQITIPNLDIGSLPKAKQDQIINNIIRQVVGTVALVRASGSRKIIPQSRTGGGILKLRKFIRSKIKNRTNIFTPDIYSIIFGIRAKPREKIKLLKKGRTFTGLERRAIVR